MNKTTKLIADAWSAGRKLHLKNTHTNGKSVWLFDNEIVRRVNNEIMFTFAGYPTRTTRERLNGLLYDQSIGFSIRKGQVLALVDRYDGQRVTVDIDDNTWYFVSDLREGEPEREPVEADDWAAFEA